MSAYRANGLARRAWEHERGGTSKNSTKPSGQRRSRSEALKVKGMPVRVPLNARLPQP